MTDRLPAAERLSAAGGDANGAAVRARSAGESATANGNGHALATHDVPPDVAFPPDALPPPLPELPPEAQSPPAGPLAADTVLPTDTVLPREAFRPPPPPDGAVTSAETTSPGTTPPVATVAAVSAVEAPPEEDAAPRWSEAWLHVPSWMTSAVAHLLLVLLLGLLATVPTRIPVGDFPSVAADGEGGEPEEIPGDPLLPASTELEDAAPLVSGALSDLPPAAVLASALGPINMELPKAPAELGGGGGTGSGGLGDGLGGLGGHGNSLNLRLNKSSRDAAVRSGGGTKESEYAVQAALRWLAEHQNSDGSWSFEHQKSPKCHGACANPGYMPGNIASTALGLLPFLGAGQTQLEGDFKPTVEHGLRYLVRSMEMHSGLGSLWEPGGQMYGHGLATIALCEAYGMTHDKFLEQPTRAAVRFIVAAQDERGGGWRYRPQQPGDTSVLGWQLMALKSAQMAYLREEVPEHTLRKAGYFLDSVQSERGATYGYQDPDGRRPATTAIGLLCRMYLGWKPDHKGIEQGVRILGQLGPSIDNSAIRNNMYYNYYATQVMHHCGGYPWQRWNAVMRDYLVQSQSKNRHETGSWYFEGADHGGPAGGRLYCTALAAMTLEVYYRYMPLYRDQSVHVAE